MKGLTLQEAQAMWKADGDVICPWCENHIYEDELHPTYHDLVLHEICLEECRRVDILESEQAEVYDPQQD
jgi:uncharacterized Zn finger protein (UPF0148 family)